MAAVPSDSGGARPTRHQLTSLVFLPDLLVYSSLSAVVISCVRLLLFPLLACTYRHVLPIPLLDPIGFIRFTM